VKVLISILALIVILALLSLINIPALIKQKQKKELIVASLLYIMSFILSLLLILGVKIPNPNEIITSIIKAMLGIE